MNELQMEELKVCVFSVGIACASDQIFTAVMIALTLLSFLRIALIRMSQRLKKLEDLQKSNTNDETR